MKNFKTKIKAYGFSWTHAQLLVVAFVLFAVLVYSQSNINFKTLFVKAEDSTPTLTYEEVRAQVLAEQGSSDTNDRVSQDADAQLALLDRSLDEGQVLGAISGLGETPDADSLFTPDALAQINVREVNTFLSEDIKTYSDRILFIESKYDVLGLLANMNSTDKASIKAATEQVTNIVSTMGVTDVPTPLVELHRYKMMYYTILMNIGQIWLGERAETDLQPQSTMLFSVMAKIESLKTSINQQYGVQL